MVDVKLTVIFYSEDNHPQRILKISSQAYDAIKSNINKHLMDMAHDFHASKFQYFIAPQ